MPAVWAPFADSDNVESHVIHWRSRANGGIVLEPADKGETHAPRSGPDSQRRPGRPPRVGEDVAARGAAVRGGGDATAGHGARPQHRLGLRSRRAGPPDVDLRDAQLDRVAGPQDQPARHARRAELRGRRARRAARVRVGRVRRQRRDGRRGHHQPPVGARRRARHRPDAVREHARPRARRLLPHARSAQGRVRAARRRDRDPDRLRARARGRDRPRGHEGLPPGARAERGGLERDPDPRGRGRARRTNTARS